jgi:3'(2'), 5'-bisphosphate nucleotidase
MKWNEEQQAAVRAVRAAATACQAIQKRLVRPETLEKKDKSPVTVADFASQAVVCAHLKDVFPNDLMIGEEDAAELREESQANVRRIVVQHVAAALGRPAHDDEVLAWIDHGASVANANEKPRRYWTLDPIDGTKGFLRAEQYAVALALIEDGQVLLGALACPNLPMPDHTIGTLLVASRGQGTRMLSLANPTSPGAPVRGAAITSAACARFCESVEPGHSDQEQSAKIARALGITAPPLRMDSQAKYAAVARGDAHIYLRLPTRADYQEKIWDHAAGTIVVEEAGGRVTDIAAKPLDFSRGSTLSSNKGVVATCGTIHDAVIAAVRTAVA